MRDKKLARAAVENFSVDVFKFYRPSFDLKEFKELMRSYGFLEEWDLDLLIAKYFYGMSYRQIESDFNYVSFSTIRWRLKHLHKLLVERGFTHRKRK